MSWLVIDTVGNHETYKQAFYARDLAGTGGAGRGAHSRDGTLELPLLDMFGRGGALKST